MVLLKIPSTQGTFHQSHDHHRRRKRTTHKEHHQSSSKSSPSKPIPTATSGSLGRYQFYSAQKPNPSPRELPYFSPLHLPIFSSFFFAHTDPYSSGLTFPHLHVFSWFVPLASLEQASSTSRFLQPCPPHRALRSALMLITFLTPSYCYHISAGVDNLLASTSIPLPCALVPPERAVF